MADEKLIELHRQLRTGQDKYTYFLLAAAASAVAFAVVRTEGRTLAPQMIPLGAAVLCWGASFLAGCRVILYVNSTVYSNVELLMVESGSHPRVGTHPQLMAAASEGIRQAMEGNSNTTSRLGRWQFRFFVIGCALFVAWHVLEMAMRTAGRVPGMPV